MTNRDAERHERAGRVPTETAANRFRIGILGSTMSDPLGDAARSRLTAAAIHTLEREGYDVHRPESSAEPPAIATRGAESVSVEPLASDDIDPTTVASRLGHAASRDRRALFVVGSAATERRLRELLSAPVLVVDERDGRRRFHSGPDRIPVQGGGYACVHVEGPFTPEIRWRETDTPIGPVPAAPGIDPTAMDGTARPTVPRLLCEVDGEVVAVLAGVESLRMPPASAFPFSYARNASDKRFRVRRGHDGRVIDDFAGFAAMREAGYVPLPMPLVPEHVLGELVEPLADGPEGHWELVRIVEDG
ncbi:hypothetical protein [Halorubrum vacuolatum]|uniref:hypothetical protein n=1 Tax=Halorubrum vacuolatum TaxID=63740 RepID=UPI0037443E70